MKKLSLSIIILFSITLSIRSQEYNDYLEEIFFIRQASAKTEAMGRILVLNYDDKFVSQSNPANLIDSKGISAFFSHSSELYLIEDASFSFGGISYNHKKWGAFAFNYTILDYGTFIDRENSNSPIVEYQSKQNLYTLSYSNNFKDLFNYGININYLVDNSAPNNTYKSMFFELGLSKKIELVETKKISYGLCFATQIKNLFNQSTKIDNYQYPFPSILRLGISNEFNIYESSLLENYSLIGFKVGFEYQDLLNSKFRTAYKVGCELSLADILFLRAGYFTEEQIQYVNSKDVFEDVTYGAGLKFELERFTSITVPLTLNIDYVNMKQPPYVVDYEFDNFSTVTFALTYGL